MRIGYGIDPDKTISPRSISFLGGKITRSDLEGCSSPAGFLESGKAAPLRNLKSPHCVERYRENSAYIPRRLRERPDIAFHGQLRRTLDQYGLGCLFVDDAPGRHHHSVRQRG